MTERKTHINVFDKTGNMILSTNCDINAHDLAIDILNLINDYGGD